MRKIILILFLLSLSFVCAYDDPSEIIGYTQDYSIKTYTSDDVRYYLDNQPFVETLKNLYDNIIESNFTINYMFEVEPRFFQYPLKIYLGNSAIIKEIFDNQDVFGVASVKNKVAFMGIDVENIYAFYNASEENLFLQIENTFLHELAHVYSYDNQNDRKIKKNMKIIFNISSNNSYKKLFNQEYFENISTFVSGEVPPTLANSVRFTNVYNTYPSHQYVSETIVRIMAVCYTEERNLSNLEAQDYRVLVPTNYTFCQRFPNLYPSFISRGFSRLYEDVVLGMSSSLKNIPKREIIVQSPQGFIEKFKFNIETFGLKFILIISLIVIVQIILITYLGYRFYKKITKFIK